MNGGAIYFNKNRPIGIENNTFGELNYAPYGSSIGSYAFDVRLIYQDFNYLFSSGQVYKDKFGFELIDYDGQRMTTDDTS